MANPEWKTGDTWPLLTGTCEDENGPVDLSTAASVRVVIKPPTGATFGSAATLIGGGTTGQWSYKWGASDLTQVGDYSVEVEVTWASGTTPPEVETFPNNASRNPKITVSADLD